MKASTLLCTLLLFGCGDNTNTLDQVEQVASFNQAASVKFMVASDIQEGSWSKTVRFEKTAQVIEKENPDYVISAGDLSNSRGTANDYLQFDRAWGRFKNKILAVPGNHDYKTDKANPFFDYFNGVSSMKGLPEVGTHAGIRGKGYFAINVGAWTIIGLNFYANGHSYTAGDAQMTWLENTMKNKPKGRPVLFYSHPPRYTRVDKGGYENAGKISVVWDVMMKYAPDVKIYIAGHSNGNYERWQPMNNKKLADANGIRSFLVATGGTSPYKGGTAGGLLESTAQLFGAMKLVLRPNGYDWDYKPIDGYTFTDKGSLNF